MFDFRYPPLTSLVLLLMPVLLLAAGCRGTTPSVNGDTAMEGAGERALDRCTPAAHTFTVDVDNAYFPLPVGRRMVLQGKEDGETVRVEITVLNETEEVGGVATRVVEERETVGGDLAEISRNYYAQNEEGTVCYFGEAVDVYENGEVTSHEGAWRADGDGHAPGTIMPADPQPGMRFQLELAPGVAVDMAEIVERGGTVTVPYGRFDDTLRLVEWNPLEGATMSDGEKKVFAPGVGPVVDATMELVALED